MSTLGGSTGGASPLPGVPFTQVDAFSTRPFSGNPAAVLELKEFLPDTILTKIAAENNLSETAYVVPRAEKNHYDLRWFTPTVEVNLCGHATMAAAHTIFTQSEVQGDMLYMHTKSGELTVTRKEGGMLAMDLPAWPQGDRPEMLEAVADAIGARPSGFLWTDGFRDGLAVFESPQAVLGLKPDLAKLAKLPMGGLICTAEGPFDGHDCDIVYRFFAPSLGIDEDPACGSAQCALAPYWAQKLSKHDISSYQLSARRAELSSTWLPAAHEGGESRVVVSGHAVTVIRGTMRYE